MSRDYSSFATAGDAGVQIRKVAMGWSGEKRRGPRLQVTHPVWFVGQDLRRISGLTFYRFPVNLFVKLNYPP